MKKLRLTILFLQAFLSISVLIENVYSQDQQFRITGGESLDLYQIREQYRPPGVVTIVKETTGSVLSDLLALDRPRSGSEEFIKGIQRIVTSWKYANFPLNSKMYITVDANEGSLKLDLQSLSESAYLHQSQMTFPDPDNQKDHYVLQQNFNPEKIQIKLYPLVLQKMEKTKSAFQDFIDKLNIWFFVIFSLIAFVAIGISIYYLASWPYAIGTMVIGVIIFSPLLIFYPNLLTTGFVVGYWLIWIVIAGASVLVTLVWKAALDRERIEAPKEELENIFADWGKAITEHRQLIKRGDKNEKDWDTQVGKKLKDLLGEGDKKKVNQKRKNSFNSPWGKVLKAGIENHLNNKLEWYTSQEIDRGIEKQMESAIDHLKGRGLDGLWAIAGIAPMIGLFGTVVGIAGAFGKISSFGLSDTGERITQMAGNINVALYTTIVGLIIGIPSLLFYYFIKAKIDAIKSEWFASITDITSSI